MSVIEAGTEVPEFTLQNADGKPFTKADLLGRTSVLVFYPYAFSGHCTNQLTTYEGVIHEFEGRGATLYAISTDPRHSQAAFKEQLGSSVEQLSDFEPKGATAKAFGAYFEPGGMTNRALVVVGPDGVVRWSWVGESPGDVPGPELVHAGLDAV
ncbi:MAG TPA: redoxin domain-containing protein [Solirubrobacteraceae bacterium]|nr:redoxin domain-containing protein [Solirubrobacteraceae bacterium]